MSHVPTAYEVETFSGNFVDTKAPDPGTIVLEDIAHALAMTCRYGGHALRFNSVAEHAVFVSRRLESIGGSRDLCLAGLHHDDPEAYLGDIPRPIKPLLGAKYKHLTTRMERAIATALGFSPDVIRLLHSNAVKEADVYALLIEARHLLPSRGVNWSGSFSDWDMASAVHVRDTARRTPVYWTRGINPSEAEGLYLSRHWELAK
jgi:uncharacterized protein